MTGKKNTGSLGKDTVNFFLQLATILVPGRARHLTFVDSANCRDLLLILRINLLFIILLC